MVHSALDKRLKTYASSMRRGMTPAEHKLWVCCLRDSPIRFRRQKIVNGFIVDFFCHAAQLAIELDGSQHYTDYGKSYDQWRSGIIEKNGICVLRFSNGDIIERFDGVKQMIYMIITKRIKEIAERKR